MSEPHPNLPAKAAAAEQMLPQKVQVWTAGVKQCLIFLNLSINFLSIFITLVPFLVFLDLWLDSVCVCVCLWVSLFPPVGTCRRPSSTNTAILKHPPGAPTPGKWSEPTLASMPRIHGRDGRTHAVEGCLKPARTQILETKSSRSDF